MAININCSSFFAEKGATSYLRNLAARTQVSENTEPVRKSSVTISEAGRAAASLTLADAAASSDGLSDLRELVAGYDFRDITPRQMAALAVELRKREELSQEVACSFVGIELNTVVQMNPDEPIDMVSHFQWMLEVVSSAAAVDSTLNDAVEYRRQASQALADIMSFAQSDRAHTSKRQN